jgi:A/G-specific adenine glycosylase
VGEVLLQRTRADLVAPVYENFLRRWPTPARLANAKTSQIRKVISTLGLDHRAKSIKALGARLHEARTIPSTPEELIRLPGVGPYTAHAVPIFAHGTNLPLVDWVIARVLRRYFGLAGDRRPNQDTQLWNLAREMADRGSARAMWLGTLDFAASVCRPKPQCLSCPLRNSCVYALQKVDN